MTDAAFDDRWRSPKQRVSSGQTRSLRVSRPDYEGHGWTVFGLTFTRILITLLTLGIGRFWMLTRLRRYYWSSIRIMGEPLEYTGRALEKLTGFLIAVVILAAYLGFVQLTLAYIGLSYFQGNQISLQLSVLAILPLTFWAQYRARRYLLARTRWSGIRFALGPGAWRYTLVASFWWVVTIISAGLLYPLLQLQLARFTTNRTYFGSLQFQQKGGAGPLLVSWLPCWISGAVPLALIVGFFYYDMQETPPDSVVEFQNWVTSAEAVPTIVGAIFLFVIWMALQFARHSTFTHRYLHSNKSLGEHTSFEANLSTWTVIAIYVGGSILIFLASIVVSLIISLVIVLLGATSAINMENLGELDTNDVLALIDAGAYGLAILAVAVYFSFIATSVALAQMFLIHPMIRAVCNSTKIYDPEAALSARQRPHDRQIEAGGFADALGADIGGI